MAATAKLISRTFTVGVAAGDVDVKDAFNSNVRGHQALQITNVSSTAIVAIGWNGVTASLSGTRDDVRHIGPFGYIVIPYFDILNMISSVAATPVEISVI